MSSANFFLFLLNGRRVEKGLLFENTSHVEVGSGNVGKDGVGKKEKGNVLKVQTRHGGTKCSSSLFLNSILE